MTHSYEVSNLCRSIGVRLAFEFPDKVFGDDYKELNVERNIPALLASIGLEHDLGNPPFGHQGEVAIRQWFVNKGKVGVGGVENDDFKNFDGNAQTLRLLARLQILNDDYGLNLTYAALSALIKYPCFWGSQVKYGYKKAGVFESERDIAEEVWSETGLDEGIRHPLTYVMEACDDIAYSVLDAEDAVKMGYASFYDLMDYLEQHKNNDLKIDKLISKAREKNSEYKCENLSSGELNDMSMQMFIVLCKTPYNPIS